LRKIHDRRGNLISDVEGIKKLGAKTTKSLPQNIVERAKEKEGDN